MDYDFYTTGAYNTGGLLGALAGMLVLVSLISLAVAIFGIIVMWKIFKKAGKAGWIAIVPLYNIYTLFEITWGKGWYCLLLLISIIPVLGWIADIVIIILAMIKLSKAFGKDTGFTVGLIFLSLIFLAILAFDKSTYLGVPTKGGNNMQPAGPQPNEFQNAGSESITPTPILPQGDMPAQQGTSNEPPTPELTTNQFQYDAPNTSKNTETSDQQPIPNTTFNQVSNENQTVTPPANEPINPVPPVIEPSQQSSFCTNCGASLPEGTIFCPNCGTPKAS